MSYPHVPIRFENSEESHRRLAQAINYLIDRTKYLYSAPSGLTLNTGSTSDALSDLQTPFDGNTYTIAEAAGSTPGMDLDLDFTDITRFFGVVFAASYVGGSSHYVTASLWNYTTSSADVFITCQTGYGQNYRYIEVPDSSDYIDASGNAQIVVLHPSLGVAGHNLTIDYVALLC